MTGGTAFKTINEAKASMDYIYDQPDPRAYFRELSKLDYGIPGAAKPIFQRLISRLRRARGGTVRLLDLGCSYGVNAALLKHDLSMPDLYEHWGGDDMKDAAPAEVAAAGRHYFGDLETQEDIEVIGFDPAGSAVAFAAGVGLLDEGLSVNLEEEPLPKRVADDVAAVDLVTSTGCVGYVTERSFERLLPALTEDQPAWIGNFVLRLFPYEPIEETLGDWGYVTEKLEGRAFVQRRFATPEERDRVLAQLRGRGIDPAGCEDGGYLVAEFYLSRPAKEAAEVPIEDLLGGDTHSRVTPGAPIHAHRPAHP